MLYGATEWFKASEKRCRFLRNINSLITKLVYLIYPIIIIFMIINRDTGVGKIIIVPAVSLVVVTVIRKIINAPRPYQVDGIDPIIHKDTEGNSFPSRHAFSVFVLAMAALYVNIILGIVVLVMGLGLCLVRVIGGVHYIKDVTAGAVMGILAGILIFVL